MTERGKILNPEYSIFRDQPIAGASPLRINTLLSCGVSKVRNPQTRIPLDIAGSADKAGDFFIPIPDIPFWQFFVAVWAMKGTKTMLLYCDDE